MASRFTIAVDTMSGDFGPRSTIPASKKFARAFPDTCLVLLIGPDTPSPEDLPPNIRVERSASVVTMDDSPAKVLRNKQDSTMALAIKSCAETQVDAAISCGNTGALVALGRHLLGTFDNIRRPAICKAIPTLAGHSYMLDLGANAVADAGMLHSFALMGSAMAAELDGLAQPRVALLNIGVEHSKGNRIIHEADALLRQDQRLNYVGYIEGDSIYSGAVDVIVADGFVGNVALKVSEGVARLALGQLKSSFRQNLYGRMLGRIAQPLLRKWHKQFDPARYNGACLLGLNGPLIKSHGGADERGFYSALEMARELVSTELTQRLRAQTNTAMAESEGLKDLQAH